jgi:hypothetical protein
MSGILINHVKVFILACILMVSAAAIAGADQETMQAELSTHAVEGDVERIAFHLAVPLSEPLFLEVYEFHYIMFPDLAPEEDAWPHEQQMRYMQEVNTGRAEAYAPLMTDEKVREILHVSPMRTVALSSIDGETHYTDWEARHGRIFFRVRNEAEYLDESIYTMRVHCRHIDMRTVEKLKEQLQTLKLPLKHKNSSFAAQRYSDLNTTYTSGHSLRFMLQHHERDTEELDALFTDLEALIAESDFNRAGEVVTRIEHEIIEKEREFFRVNAAKTGQDIHVEVEDVINQYSFLEDPAAEVYVKEYREPTMEELMTRAHSGPMDHVHGDHAAHAKMLKPDKDLLTKDAFALERSPGSFSGSLPEEWDAVSVIILYGAGQNYYITHRVARN